MYDQKINELIDKYIKIIQSDENKYNNALEERNSRKKYYQSFDYNSIINMSDEEVIEYLGKLWSVMHIQKHKIYDKNGHDNFKKRLAEFLYGAGELKDRYDDFHDNITEFKISGMSEVLTYNYPDECIIWNKKVKTVFEMIGFDNIPEETDNINYEWYKKLIEDGRIVQEKLSERFGKKIDLLETDNFYEMIYSNTMQIDYKKLDKAISNYLDEASDRIPNELFKVEEIKKFQENWDINASDFKEMLEKSFVSNSILLNAPHEYALGMIIGFSEKEPETLRKMFRYLFNESIQLKQRIEFFQNKATELLKKYWDDSNDHFQTMHAISIYLSFMYPDKYYMYKPSLDKNAVKVLGQDIVHKKKDKGKEEDLIKTLLNFFDICDDVHDYIIKNKNLINAYDSYVTDACYKDDDYHTLVGDILMYIGQKQKINDSEMVEDDNMIENNNLSKEWIVPANSSLYDHMGAFNKYGYIDWTQNVKYKVGDIVYLYSTAPDKKIKYLTQVEKINIENDEKTDDTEFNKSTEFVSNNGKYVRLKLIKVLDDDRLVYDNLLLHGLKGNIQGQMRIRPELSSYLHYVIEGTTFESTNIIYYGGPGCGKSKRVERKYCQDEKTYIRTTFYPDYTNSDFIGQLIPKYDKEKEKLIYDIQAGPFTKVLELAYKPENINKNVYLIIEEINRGNAAAIFGDIFQLLDRTATGESEYKISNYIIEKYLKDNLDLDLENKIEIPANLTIIATMNTSDQNVYTLDSAFKRRWKMKYISNKFEIDEDSKEYDKELGELNVPIKNLNITWKDFNTKINKAIIEQNTFGINSEDKQLGKYFVGTSDLISSEIYETNNFEEASKIFAEKVLMYLWEDIAKLKPSDWFREDIKTLEKLLDNYQEIGIDVFSENIKNKLKDGISKTEQENV